MSIVELKNLWNDDLKKRLASQIDIEDWTDECGKIIMTLTGINEDVPEYMKFHDLIEELKKNKDIKGLQRYVAEHILPVLIKKTDQTIKKVIELLDMKYGRSRTEKVEEAVEDLLKFREDQYEDDDELILAMKELRQRCVELKMTFDEFHSVWMLEKMKKRRKMENFEIQALRNVVKEGGLDVVKNFKKKFKEIKIEGKRKALLSSAMFTDKLPRTYYTEEEIEVMYMGTESEARKRFQGKRNGSFNRRRPSFDGRQ